MTDPLRALAARADHEPFFLASLLAACARADGLDDAALAARLGCAPGDLTMIRLCRAPRTDPREFWDDVNAVAERFGLEPQRLAEVVKHGRVALTFRAAGAEGRGSLLAARDHDEEPPDPPEEP